MRMTWRENGIVLVWSGIAFMAGSKASSYCKGIMRARVYVFVDVLVHKYGRGLKKSRVLLFC